MSEQNFTQLPAKVKDLSGQVFGRLTVIRFIEVKNSYAMWNCSCQCGNSIITRSSSLKNGHTQSCGCLVNGLQDLTGQVFGRMTVVRIDESFGKRVKWICRCECGNEKSVTATHLKSGYSKSCGCYNKENLSRIKATHGMTRVGNHHPFYNAWSAMKSRCEYTENPAYNRYGGRGIKVCDRWQSFENFVNDIGDRPSSEFTIDRIDNDGDYSPENCRWADKTQQARNRRSNKIYLFQGESLTLPEWSERTGISASLLFARINYLGWTVEKSLSTKKRNQSHGNQ